MSTSITTTENIRSLKREEPAVEERLTLTASPAEIDGSQGVTLPGYEVLDCLGQGGMGVVYKARHLALNRLVAIKVLLAGPRATAFARKRFRAEAEALACLNHPHIVQIHEVGEHNGQPFFVMEYMAGGNLTEYAAAALLPANRSAQLLRDLAGAVHCAHHRGIVHRDLKPGNVLLTEDAVAKISDFGVARQLHAGDNTTRDGAVIGSPGYMSPEQARGQSNLAGPAADVYALGAILYRLLAGKECFGHVSSLAQLRLLLEEDPVPPRRLQTSVPRDLETICLKCLRKEAGERYASALDLADDLGRFLDGEPIHARPVGRGERLVKWARRHPARASVCALLLVVALLGVGIAFALSLWRQAEEQREVAEDAQQQTETARQAASAARDNLADEQKHTRAALQREETARKRAEDLQARLAVTDYFHRIDLAYREWRDNQVHRGRQVLSAMPPAGLRGWEWEFVRGLNYSEEETVAGHQAEICGLAVDREGTILVSAGRGRQLVFWDLNTRRSRRSSRPGAFQLTCVDLHPGAKLTATGGFDRSVRLWDTDSAQQVHTFAGHAETVKSVVFSPDGKLLASASADRTIKVWDVEGRKELRTLRGHGEAVNCLAFTPDGRLVSGSNDRTIRVWDPASGQLLHSFEAHWSAVLVLRLTPDGKQFVSGSLDGTIRFWDVATWKQQGEDLRRKHPIYALAVSPDGKTLAAAGRDGEIQLYDRASGREREAYRSHLGAVHALHFLGKGDSLVSAGADQLLHFWRLDTPPRVATLTGHHSAVLGVAFGKDGLLASASHDCTVKLWNTRTGQEVKTLRGHAGPVRSLDFHPTLPRLAAGGAPLGVVLVWDFDTGRELRKITTPWRMLSCVRYSPDGRYLAAGEADGKPGGESVVRLWQAETGTEYRTLPAHRGGVNALAFTPDGRLILTAGRDGLVRGWEVDTGKEALPAKKLGASVMGLAIAPDGKRVVCCLVNARVAHFALDRPEITYLQSHTSAVYGVAFLEGSKRFVTASLDGTVKIWHAATGLEALTVSTQPEEFFSVAVSPDQTTIAGGSRNGSVKIWAAPPRR